MLEDIKNQLLEKESEKNINIVQIVEFINKQDILSLQKVCDSIEKDSNNYNNSNLLHTNVNEILDLVKLAIKILVNNKQN